MPLVLAHQPLQHEGEQRQRVFFALDLLLQTFDDGGIEQRRGGAGFATQDFRGLADDMSDLAVRHRTEAERHLIDAGERFGALHGAVGIRTDADEKERRVAVNGAAGELKEFFAFGCGAGREQLLALIQTQDWKRIGRLGNERALRRGLTAARAAAR